MHPNITEDHINWEFSTINVQTTAQLSDNLKAAYDKLYDDVFDAVTVNDLDLIDYYKTHKSWNNWGPGQIVHVLGLRGTQFGNRVIIDQTKLQAAIAEFETKLTGAGFTAPTGNNQREVEEWWDSMN